MANVYKNAIIPVDTTVLTTTYTCPATARAVIQNIQFANEAGSVDVKVHLYDVSETTTVEIGHDTLSSKETVNLAKGPIVLEEGDVILTTVGNSSIQGVISILEINRD